MVLRIGGRQYDATPAAITLIRYRAEFGKSFFSPASDDADAILAMARLAWAAIAGDKPDFQDFLKEAAEDNTFAASALRLHAAVLSGARPQASSTRNASAFDELEILALMSIAELDMRLLYELPIFQILDVIGKRADLMGGKHKSGYKKMTPAEMRGLYGGESKWREPAKAGRMS